MAVYTGLTYKKIINLAITTAKKSGFIVEWSEVTNIIDEALLEVMKDVMEFDTIQTISYPATDIIDMSANSSLMVEGVYGYTSGTYSKKFVYMPYESYRTMFLGSESQKPSGDDNYYYTQLGDDLYLEPNIDDYDSVVIHVVPLIEAYTSAQNNNEPELPFQYRMLVPYKICELLSPPTLRTLFASIYEQGKRKALSFKNKKLSSGRAQFWDVFEGSDDYRISGWGGKITTDSD